MTRTADQPINLKPSTLKVLFAFAKLHGSRWRAALTKAWGVSGADKMSREELARHYGYAEGTGTYDIYDGVFDLQDCERLFGAHGLTLLDLTKLQPKLPTRGQVEEANLRHEIAVLLKGKHTMQDLVLVARILKGEQVLKQHGDLADRTSAKLASDYVYKMSHDHECKHGHSLATIVVCGALGRAAEALASGEHLKPGAFDDAGDTSDEDDEAA
jgi:hypothetical protein